jgi:hypothetical protein
MNLNIKTRKEPKKSILYYETWLVNAYKNQYPNNIYLLEVE